MPLSWRLRAVSSASAWRARRCSALAGRGLLIEQWNLDDIGADLAWCGFKGSPTKVHRVQSIVLAGGAYGKFEQDLRGNSPSVVGFYNDQVAPAVIMGGHIDLNRSPRWVFRITPDAVLTRYGVNYGPKTTQMDINFAISVGVEYKFKKKR